MYVKISCLTEPNFNVSRLTTLHSEVFNRPSKHFHEVPNPGTRLTLPTETQLSTSVETRLNTLYFFLLTPVHRCTHHPVDPCTPYPLDCRVHPEQYMLIFGS